MMVVLASEIAELRDICRDRASDDPIWQLLSDAENAISAHDIAVATKLMSNAREKLS